MLLNSIMKIIIVALCLLLAGCNGFFEKDNVPTPKPLVEFKPTLKPTLLWSIKTGSGHVEKYLKFNPAITDTAIFTIGTNGILTATNRLNGQRNWQVNTHLSVSAGPGVGHGMVVVGSRHGEIVAFEVTSGRVLWKTVVQGEILANPTIQEKTVIVKTTNGYVQALSIANGKQVWFFKQTEPSLILRSASTPLIEDGYVIVGFANGSLTKLSLADGQLVWSQAIAVPEGAFAIQRMIDVDADPVIFRHHLYAATYQGKLASLDWTTGGIMWSHDISSYTGMVANQHSLYLTDANSHVWSFDVNTGLVNWRQNQFEWRTMTAPVLMNNYVVVGDAEGYVHWLNSQDGRVMAREFAGASIYVTPIVKNNILYVMTSNGYLLAYRLR